MPKNSKNAAASNQNQEPKTKYSEATNQELRTAQLNQELTTKNSAAPLPTKNQEPTAAQLMLPLIRQFDDFESAEQAEREDDRQMPVEQRFRAFMQIMEPYYAAAGRLQRIYRTSDLRGDPICDDWGLRLQPLPQPSSD